LDRSGKAPKPKPQNQFRSRAAFLCPCPAFAVRSSQQRWTKHQAPHFLRLAFGFTFAVASRYLPAAKLLR
jgi:hypothetical protein